MDKIHRPAPDALPQMRYSGHAHEDVLSEDYHAAVADYNDRSVLDFIDRILMEVSDDDAHDEEDAPHLIPSPSAAPPPAQRSTVPALEGDHINYLYKCIFNDFYHVLLPSSSPPTSSNAALSCCSSASTPNSAHSLLNSHPSSSGGVLVSDSNAGSSECPQHRDCSPTAAAATAKIRSGCSDHMHESAHTAESPLLIPGGFDSSCSAIAAALPLTASTHQTDSDDVDSNGHGSAPIMSSSSAAGARYPWQRPQQQQRWCGGRNGSQLNYDVIIEQEATIERPTGNRDNSDTELYQQQPRQTQLKPIIMGSTSHFVIVDSGDQLMGMNPAGNDRESNYVYASTAKSPTAATSNTATKESELDGDGDLDQRRRQKTAEALNPSHGQFGRRTGKTTTPSYSSYSYAAESHDFSFHDDVLELEAEYNKLYVVNREGSNGRNKNQTQKEGARAGMAAASKRKGGAGAGYYDLEEMLLNCAQAVARWDVKKAREMVKEVNKVASEGRSSLHRMAGHFCNALEARLDGRGASLYAASARFGAFPSSHTVRSLRRLFTAMPSIKMSHFVANQTIAAACSGRRRLHIVDYGIGFGLQWPHLIKSLSQRHGGPPMVLITGVEQPHRASSPNGRGAAELVEQTGRRLTEYARLCGVAFEFHAVTSTEWEELDEAALKVRAKDSDTVLVVNSVKRMETVADESGGGGGEEKQKQKKSSRNSSARQRLLCRMRELKPEIMVIGVSNGSHNAPTFMTRFKETLQYYTGVYEMLEATGVCDCPERLLLERRMIEPAIVNTVACEGGDRVERPESYRQWQGRIQRAGFSPLPLPQPLASHAADYVGAHYHPDNTVLQEHPWLLFGWRGRISLALSVWSSSSTAADPHNHNQRTLVT